MAGHDPGKRIAPWMLERNDVMPGIANRAWVDHAPDLDPLRELPRFKAFVTTPK